MSPDRECPISHEGKVSVVIKGGGGDTKVNSGRVPDGMARVVDYLEVAFSGMELEVGSKDGAYGLDGDTSKVNNNGS